MADYYPLIAKAVAALDPSAPSESRRALYERARAALMTQMRGVNPPLSNSEIARERLALEEAVRKVEEEVAAQQRTRYAPIRAFRDIVADADDLGRAALQASPGHHVLQGNDLVAGRRPVAPPVTIIPEQNLEAIGFSPTRRGPLDLVSDPPRDPFDPEQTILYQRIRSQLKQLKETIPSQERTQIDAAVHDFLDQPENWREVEFKKVLWLCGNSIRTLLTQHDALKDDPEPHYSKLPPAVAEALRRPVQGWNVFVQTDQDLAQLDAQRLGPQEQIEILKHLVVAEKFITLAAADRKITTERAANALTSTLKAASNSNNNINTRLAQDLADKSSKNYFSQILRPAYLVRDAIIDLDADSAKKVALGFVTGAASTAGGDTLSYLGSHALSFFEFVATNPGLIKEYILVAFQNSQLTEIVDAIKFEYLRLKTLGGNDH